MCANDCAHTMHKLLIYNNLAVADDIHAIGQALDGIRGFSACGTSAELQASEGIYLDGGIAARSVGDDA